MEGKNCCNPVLTKSQIICNAICGVLVLVSVIVYLTLGITIGFWHPGWLIVAIAGVMCGIIGIISTTLGNLKTLKEKETKNDNENIIDQ